uniref:ABC transporter domain-containing protein n=1 Tax=Globisporangium ultimum (strain ATCC 200006 / CBS 805.95 / DAOM BR144) TaxID=431595 RepID=K3WZJ7_GLOUD
MDEISTGLDSAATFDIIKTQRSIAKKFRKTVVIALLQRAPEVFELFDDVMIVNEGEVMYHGPREQVVDYFKDLGFVCPPERDIADYLLDLGTKQQHKYAVGASLTQAKLPRSPSEFAEAFRQSAIHASMLRDLNEPHSSELLANVGAHMEPMPKFHQSFWENTWTLIRRESMVTMRNTPALMGRAVMVILMGLINSTMFFQLNPTQVQVVMGIVFATVLFLSLSQMALIPTNLAARTIFYKQRHANFYRTSSYVLANSISQLPLIMIETIAFGTMVYWMCGFHSSASSYLIFEVVLFLTNVAFGAWFFFVAVASPNIHLANSIASVSVLLFILFAGFVVLKSQIPDYFIWLYWLSPITWGIRAIAINEYRSDTYDVCDYDGVAYCEQFGGMTMGEYYLSLYDIESKKEWIAYGMIYLVLVYLVFMGLSSLWLEYIRYESPEDVYVMATKDIEEHPGYALAETPKASSKSTSYELNEKIVVAVQPSTNSSIIPVTVAFCDLWYSVPSPSNPKESIDLLKGITGFALPGTITALMGSSGAGKTTLMDVIAGRKTGGKIRGQILLNGHAATDLAIRRCTGYCEQMDIHSESSTIREALTFSAFLRQDSSVPDSQKYDSVNECLDLLDMHDIADQIIRGRSVEQMKRLTIGVELAAQPSVLFLDEPTSGLDARSAKLIMDGVRKVANTGRTIICTIHQPSSEVFFLFDRLLLLKRGGETVFFGDLGVGCHNLVNYFEAIPGIASLPEGYNPATWMLECIGAGVSNGAGNDMDFAKCFNESEQKRMLDSKIMTEGIGHPAQGNSALAFSKKRAASSMTQMTFVVSRFMTMYWRTSAYNLTRMLLSLVVALLFGLMFTKADYASYQGTVSGAGMLYEVVIFNGLMSFESILPIISHERASFYRERASQTYNAFWYFVGSTIAEIPYVLASTLIFTVVFFPMVGFTGFWTGVLFWINLSLLVLCHAYLGQLFAFAFPSEEVATILGVLVMSIFFLLMGFSPPTSAIPAGLKWIHYITPHTYSLSIFVALVFADCPQNTTFDSGLRQFTHLGSALGCQPLKNAPVTLNQVTVKQFTEDVFDMKHDDISTNFVILIGIIVLLRLLALLSLRFVNHQKK